MIERLIPALTQLRDDALGYESSFASELSLIEPDYRDSARNLLHYLSVRQHDLRDVQNDLGTLGLSSLGRLEAHTLATLNAVLSALYQLGGDAAARPPDPEPPVSFRAGSILLQDHARRLLGRLPAKRSVRVMVTMPSEAATDPALVRNLMAAGMDVMRINCAHDDPEAWARMVANLRRAESESGRSCRVQADLAGPKLRTGAIEPVDHVIKVRPRKDVRGRVTTKAAVWLTPAEAPQPAPLPAATVLPVAGAILTQSEAGDIVRFQDCRKRSRAFTIVSTSGISRLAEADRTSYLAQDMELAFFRGARRLGAARVGALPGVVAPILLKPNDVLILTRAQDPGRAARLDENGRVLEPSRIPCSLDAVFDQVKTDEHVWFDDGKIGGVVVGNDGREIEVRITHAGREGAKLLSDKGINLPDTVLDVAALTDRDMEDLESVAKLVDIVALSFVRAPEDVHILEDHLHRLGAGHLGIVVKVETRLAFENLPKILLAGMRSPPVGVMVARGDLAVEVGFERLAEVQEEILWLCEAAHVPVIWATQVLEGLAKRGAPSRAEVTDAAMSSRAECVMLNKGPNIVATLGFLEDILTRMAAHQSKKTAMLRELSVSRLR
jgi:pyruvate kinase